MPTAPPAAPSRRETAFVAALAIFAALRVACFAAAFPFFANIDEQKHVDMVLKYADGYLPRPGRDAYQPEMGQLVGLYGSPEYLQGPSEPAPPPAWRRTPAGMLGVIAASERFLAERANKEAEQPPFYYAVAGAWLRLGRALGFEGARLLYFVRGIGALVAGALVWVAHRLVRELYRDETLVRWGVPLLSPSSRRIRSSTSHRTCSRRCWAVSVFALSLRLARRPESGALVHAAAGLVLAAALLTKWTNAALWVVAAAASLHAIAHASPAAAARRFGAKLALQWTLALAPVAFWCERSLRLYGDPTGSALKVARLGWGRKPLAEWLEHPIFTPSGVFEFATGLIPTFWRGELAWHRTDLALPAMDALYTASTLLLLVLALAGLRGREPGRFLAEGLALVAVAVATGLLALLSLAFVFDATTNPSASRPYFVQGRLISGVLLPFLLVYLRGLEVATARLPARAARRLGSAAVIALALAVSISELALAWPVFASAVQRLPSALSRRGPPRRGPRPAGRSRPRPEREIAAQRARGDAPARSRRWRVRGLTPSAAAAAARRPRCSSSTRTLSAAGGSVVSTQRPPGRRRRSRHRPNAARLARPRCAARARCRARSARAAAPSPAERRSAADGRRAR